VVLYCVFVTSVHVKNGGRDVEINVVTVKEI
jgi:hypothetical protein